MAAPCNDDLMKALSQIGTPLTRNSNINASLATGATSQQLGVLARGEIIQVLQSVVGGSIVLPSLTNGDAPNLIVVVNDSPNSINVGGSAGDKVNGVATTASFGAGVQAVASLSSVIFWASGAPSGIGGAPLTGAAGANPNNWHTAVSAGT